jgi:hypothetical protein
VELVRAIKSEAPDFYEKFVKLQWLWIYMKIN